MRVLDFRRPLGFSVFEIVFMLAVVAVLVAFLFALLLGQIGTAEETKVRKTGQSIAIAVLEFYRDTGTWPMWEDGTKTGPNDRSVKFLVSSNGDLPDVGTTKYDFTAKPAKGKGAGPPPPTDTLLNQLIDNGPGYPVTGPKRWRGPYLRGDPSDPWGKKYVLNVETLKPGVTTKDVVVLSAGPDGVIQTTLNQDPQGFVTGGDDIVSHVR